MGWVQNGSEKEFVRNGGKDVRNVLVVFMYWDESKENWNPTWARLAISDHAGINFV